MLSLEGCISGNVPRDAKPAAPVCSELREAQAGAGGLRARHLHQRGRGPGARPDQLRPRRARPPRPTAPRARRAASARGRGLSEAEQEQFAQEARRIVTATYAQRALELAVRFGLSSVPALNNPEFVLQLVFEPSLGAEVPKPRFAYLFPHSDAAVIQARLRPGLSAEERRDGGGDDPRGRGGEALRPEVRQLRRVGIARSSPRAWRRGSRTRRPALVAAAILLVALALVADVPGPAGAAAARAGSRRDGDHARRRVAAGRLVLGRGRGRACRCCARWGRGGRCSSGAGFDAAAGSCAAGPLALRRSHSRALCCSRRCRWRVRSAR